MFRLNCDGQYFYFDRDSEFNDTLVINRQGDLIIGNVNEETGNKEVLFNHYQILYTRTFNCILFGERLIDWLNYEILILGKMVLLTYYIGTQLFQIEGIVIFQGVTEIEKDKFSIQFDLVGLQA